MRIQTHRAQLGVLLIALGLCFPTQLSARPSTAQKNSSAAKQHERAVRLRTALEGKPLKDRKLTEYEQVLEAFRRVYLISPRSPKAPASMVARAEVYLEMARHVDPKYFDQAIESYRDLLHEYPGSRSGQDALLTIAEIQRNDLGDLEAARQTFQTFLERFPRSRRALRAQTAIADLDQEIAQQAAAKAKGKPMPAPAARSTLPQVTNIRHWNTQNYTRVVIDVEDEVRYQEARIANPDRIFLDLYDSKLSSALKGKTLEVGDGFLKQIRVAQNQTGVTRVVLEVEDIENYSVFSLPNPYRLVIDVYGNPKLAKAAPRPEPPPPSKETEPKVEPSESAPVEKAPAKPAAPAAGKTVAPAAKPEPTVTEKAPAGKQTVARAQPPPPAPKAARPTKNGSRTMIRALGLKIGRIVLDPGHGGHDTGTIGPTGFMEKDLVLDVALRLGKLIEERLEAEVVYTREDDTFVPLENRTALANEKQADLFLSIHANSSSDASARGIETYFLNFTTDQAALEIAARENAVSQKSIHELQDILKKIARNEKIEESREFATEVQTALYRKVPHASHALRNRGVKQAPFIVLVGANMPSVLAEIAFLSNPGDERQLKTPTERQRIAQALYDGVVKYLQSLNSVKVALKHPSPPQEKADAE